MVDNNSSLPSSLFICNTSPGATEIDTLLQSISTARSRSYLYLFVGILIALVTAGFVFVICRNMYNTIKQWRYTNPEQKSIERYYDDIEYADDSGYSPPVKEAQRIAQKMSSITALYSDYNRAVAKQAALKGDVADGVIDSRILSRKDDDFEYPDDSGRRVRHNEGREYVSVRW